VLGATPPFENPVGIVLELFMTLVIVGPDVPDVPKVVYSKVTDVPLRAVTSSFA